MLFWRKRNERLEDVADQDGLRYSLIGIAVAVLLGVLFRAAFSKEAISAHVRLAADRVHNKAKIDFASADLSLSDGIFPEFAIVVEGVKVSSDELCWLSPSAEVDRLSLPLDIWSLARGRIEISEVRLGNVKLQLRSKIEDCSRLQTKMSETPVAKAAIAPTSPSDVSPVESLERPESRGPVSRISVQSLQVQYLPIPTAGFEIDRLDIQRLKTSPLHVAVTGELNLGGAALSGDYSSRAKFRVDYSHPRVDVRMSGTWREGSYHFEMNGDTLSRQVGVSGNIDHLPLSQILGVAKKYNLVQGNYDGHQIWLNLKFRSPELAVWNSGVPVNIEALSFEGDLGKIEAKPFEVTKWSPVEMSSTEIFLKNLQVEKLLKVLGQPEKSKILESLGEMSGVLKIEAARKFSLNGEYSGLEFIFASRGVRQIQRISFMTAVLNYDHGLWNLHINQLRPQDGLFMGYVHLFGNETKEEAEIRIRMDEMHLKPEVQALMSGGGSLGRWAGRIDAKLRRDEMQDFSGHILARDILIDGLGIDRVRIDIDSEKKNNFVSRINMDLKAQDLSIEPNSPAQKFVDSLVEGLTPSDKANWQVPQLQIKTQLGQQMGEWSRFSWVMKPLVYGPIHLQSEGGWARSGELSGRVEANVKNREIRWKIEGYRDAPVFIQQSN